MIYFWYIFIRWYININKKPTKTYIIADIFFIGKIIEGNLFNETQYRTESQSNPILKQ